jgi:hypothetical protein
MSQLRTDGYPKTVWLTSEGGWPSKSRLIGETTRSWVSGTGRCLRKWAKCDYKIIPEEEALELQWANENRYKIGRNIQHGRHTAEQLRRVAEIIGYTEEPKP